MLSEGVVSVLNVTLWVNQVTFYRLPKRRRPHGSVIIVHRRRPATDCRSSPSHSTHGGWDATFTGGRCYILGMCAVLALDPSQMLRCILYCCSPPRPPTRRSPVLCSKQARHHFDSKSKAELNRACLFWSCARRRTHTHTHTRKIHMTNVRWGF